MKYWPGGFGRGRKDLVETGVWNERQTIPTITTLMDRPALGRHGRQKLERPKEMTDVSDRQHDAFDNPAKMTCREGNLRTLREPAFLLWEDGNRARLRCD
jgi:hypothetical protein